MVGNATLANLTVLAGLGWAAAVTLRLLWPRAGGQAWSWLGTCGPVLTVVIGFWLGGVNTIWLVGVVAVVLAVVLTAQAMVTGGGAASAGPATRAARPALASLLVTAVLTLVGALMAVRLVVDPDPADPMLGAVSARAWGQGWAALVIPLGGAALMTAVTWVFRATLGGDRDSELVRRVHRITRWAIGSSDRRRDRWVVVGLLLLAAGLFVAPRFGTPTGSAYLVIFGVATPEYGKLVFIALLSVMVVRDIHHFDEFRGQHLAQRLRSVVRSGGWRRPESWQAVRAGYRRLRFALRPLGLFTLVAVLSGVVRKDFGTVVSALAATIGITWAATRHNVRQYPDDREGRWAATTFRRLVRLVRGYQIFLAVGGALLVVTSGAAFVTDYVGERGTVWSDPWAYRWDSGCAPAESLPAASAPSLPAGVAAQVCRRSLAADVESGRSQIAQSLAAVTDGGLFGRGLPDTLSARVPAGSTDLILAVIWNKLGGLVVLVCALLVGLLGAALARHVRHLRPETSPSAVTLFGYGLAAMIMGQFMFVLAATTNVVPHSGVPAPFLSRGGQANLVLLLGVGLVLAIGRPAVVDPGPVGSGVHRQRRLPALPGFSAVCVALVALATLVPYPAPGILNGHLPRVYSEQRPACEARATVNGMVSEAGLTSPAPDPADCSTDKFAWYRTRIELLFGGRAGFVQDRRAGRWLAAAGAGAAGPGGLEIRDLSGLLQDGGGASGLLEASYGAALTGTAGTDLASRLSPRRDERAAGSLDLTIDPKTQHAVATALRGPGPGGSASFNGGAVVLDATTGHVLASVSQSVPEPASGAESVPEPASPPALDQATIAKFEAAQEYLPEQARTAEDSRRCDDAEEAQQRRCWMWSLAPDQTDQARTRVPNRALGTWYGLGSTFKVVVAAEFLSRGHRADDLIEAPTVIDRPGAIPVNNHERGPCTGTRNGQVSLVQALAFSCNTAFVRLAQRLGWASIAARARAFGFTTYEPNVAAGTEPSAGGCDRLGGAWLVNKLSGAVQSCVPARTDGVSIANNTLGGQDVQGTPLGLATMMAAVANGGVAIQPTLVSSVTYPLTGRVELAGPPQSRTALAPDAAAQLRQALGRTAVDGTAAKLQPEVGTQIWVKTGTHELDPAGAVPGGGRDHLWMVGFVETGRGPVAFAVVVESENESAGFQRIRSVVKALCASVRG